MSVYQAIIVVEGQSPMDLVKLSVRAGMEIMHQFDPTKSSYAGANEHKLFARDFEEWSGEECNYEQRLFIAPESDMLTEIEMFCNMEGAPTNYIDGESETKMLVVGPFDAERLRFFTQNCREF